MKSILSSLLLIALLAFSSSVMAIQADPMTVCWNSCDTLACDMSTFTCLCSTLDSTQAPLKCSVDEDCEENQVCDMSIPAQFTDQFDSTFGVCIGVDSAGNPDPESVMCGPAQPATDGGGSGADEGCAAATHTGHAPALFLVLILLSGLSLGRKKQRQP
jgi:hypothetical protein